MEGEGGKGRVGRGRKEIERREGSHIMRQEGARLTRGGEGGGEGKGREGRGKERGKRKGRG